MPAIVSVLLIFAVIGGIIPQAIPLSAAGDVHLRLVPSTTTPIIMSMFTVDVVVDAGSSEVSSVDVHLDYNPAYMVAVSCVPDTSQLETTLSPGNVATAGQVSFGIGDQDGNLPTGTFTIATITFLCMGESTNSPITFVFDQQAGRQTEVALSGNSILDGVTETAITQTCDAPIQLVASTPIVGKDRTFTMDINVETPGGSEVTEASAYIDFNPAYLEVTSVDPVLDSLGTAGTITTSVGKDISGSLLRIPMSPIINNTTGQIMYGAMKYTDQPALSIGTSFAYIKFNAIANTPLTGTNLTFFTQSSNLSTGAFSGINNVAGVITGATVKIMDQPSTAYTTPPSDSSIGGTVDIVIDTDIITPGIQDTVTVSNGESFTCEIIIQPREGQTYTNADAILNFDPTYLQVDQASFDAGNNLTYVDSSYVIAAGDVMGEGSTFNCLFGTAEGGAATINNPWDLTAIAGATITFGFGSSTHSETTGDWLTTLGGSAIPASTDLSGQSYTIQAGDTLGTLTNAGGYIIGAIVGAGGWSVAPFAGSSIFFGIDSRTSGTTQLAGSTIEPVNGYINYVGASLSGGQSNASGTFTIATVTFTAKEVVASTPLSVSVTGERKSSVKHDANNVCGTHTNTSVQIIDGGVNGTIKLQGASRPEAGHNVPVTLKIYTNDKVLTNANIMTEEAAYTYTTASGDIIISDTDLVNHIITFQGPPIPNGTYHLAVSTLHALINLRENVAVSGDTTVDMGTLIEGDANNDGAVGGADLGGLIATYWATPTVGDWQDGVADFDENGIVNALDYSLLADNYFEESPQTVVSE